MFVDCSTTDLRWKFRVQERYDPGNEGEHGGRRRNDRAQRVPRSPVPGYVPEGPVKEADGDLPPRVREGQGRPPAGGHPVADGVHADDSGTIRIRKVRRGD